MNKLFLIFSFLLLWVAKGVEAQTAHINEFHYNNVGADAHEFVEIAVQTGFHCTEPLGLQVVLYDGQSGYSYHTEAVPNEGNAVAGGFIYLVKFPTDNIQNDAPDGIALVCGTIVLQFISYGGSFRAMDGPASGLFSLDVNVVESEATPEDASIYYANGKWYATSNINAASPGYLNPTQISLPIVLKSFVVEKVDAGAKIEWTTAEEQEVDFYEVQWSNDAREFNAKKKFTNTLSGFYSYLDNEVERGDNFYRLKIHNVDGTIDYSPILKIQDNNRNPNALLKVIQNPVQNNWLLFLIAGFESTPDVTIIDAIGKVYSYQLGTQGEHRLDISKLAPGTYLLKASDATATRVVRFVK